MFGTKKQPQSLLLWGLNGGGWLDSNHRRQRQQIYSLLPLTAREILHIECAKYALTHCFSSTALPYLLGAPNLTDLDGISGFFHLCPGRGRDESVALMVSVFRLADLLGRCFPNAASGARCTRSLLADGPSWWLRPTDLQIKSLLLYQLS